MQLSETKQKGSFTAVSTGMLVAGDISVRGQQYLKEADIVFSLMSHPVGDDWLGQLNDNVIDLQYLYGPTKHRMDTYEQMVELMMAEVRKGKNVCGAFYGHAGIFAWAPHETVRKAKAEGYQASMLPGVSAEGSLYADIGIDPCNSGVQAFEATQFLFYNHIINPASLVILWQIGLIGEHTAKSFEAPLKGREILVEHLLQWYSIEQPIILYECAVLAISKPRIERVTLGQLVDAELNLITTMVIPPAQELTANQQILQRFEITEAMVAQRD